MPFVKKLRIVRVLAVGVIVWRVFGRGKVVPTADHGVFAENDSLSPPAGPGKFGEDEACGDALADGSKDRLDHEKQKGRRTHIGDGSRAIADGGLGLDGEEEGRLEVVKAQDARGACGLRRTTVRRFP